jgi:hypothetical protein
MFWYHQGWTQSKKAVVTEAASLILAAYLGIKGLILIFTTAKALYWSLHTQSLAKYVQRTVGFLTEISRWD